MIYKAIEVLKTELQKSPFVNTITEGDITDIDLNKQTIYPLAHITVNNWQEQRPTTIFSVDIILADIVDDNKDGSSNKVDIWNQQALVATELLRTIEKGKLGCDRDIKTELQGVSPAELFTDRFTNALAGTVISFTFTLPTSLCQC